MTTHAWKPLIAVSSRTGNTMRLAQAIQSAFPGAALVRADALPEDLSRFNPVMLGFWCDRGMAPEEMKAAARRFKGKRMACFATLGGDPQSPQAQAWMQAVSKALVESGEGNALEGTFLCRGRIDPAVFEAMTKRLSAELPPEEAAKAQAAREARRLAAESHPDDRDLAAAAAAFRQLFPL